MTLTYITCIHELNRRWYRQFVTNVILYSLQFLVIKLQTRDTVCMACEELDSTEVDNIPHLRG